MQTTENTIRANKGENLFDWQTGTNGTLYAARRNPVTAADIARMYSAQVVKTSAARFGWKVNTGADGKLTVTR